MGHVKHKVDKNVQHQQHHSPGEWEQRGARLGHVVQLHPALHTEQQNRHAANWLLFPLATSSPLKLWPYEGIEMLVTTTTILATTTTTTTTTSLSLIHI